MATGRPSTGSGIEPNPYRAGFLQLVAVSESDAQAEADYYEHAKYFYDNCLHIYEGFADPPGYRTQATMSKGLVSQHGKAATQARKNLSWKDLIEGGYIVAGSPESVRQQLTEVAKSLRVGHLMTLLQFGSMPKHLANKNTELFGREVLPGLRGIWSEYEDHWYPKMIPMADRARPAPLPASANGTADQATNGANGHHTNGHAAPAAQAGEPR